MNENNRANSICIWRKILEIHFALNSNTREMGLFQALGKAYSTFFVYFQRRALWSRDFLFRDAIFYTNAFTANYMFSFAIVWEPSGKDFHPLKCNTVKVFACMQFFFILTEITTSLREERNFTYFVLVKLFKNKVLYFHE